MRCYFVSCLPQHPWCITDLATVWLRPSKQIRAPLYSLKQKKQRRWIVSIFESWQESKMLMRDPRSSNMAPFM